MVRRVFLSIGISIFDLDEHTRLFPGSQPAFAGGWQMEPGGFGVVQVVGLVGNAVVAERLKCG